MAVYKGHPRASPPHGPQGWGRPAVRVPHYELSMTHGTLALDGPKCTFTKWVRVHMGDSKQHARSRGSMMPPVHDIILTHLFKGLIALKKKLGLLLETNGKYCIVFILLKQLISKCKRALEFQMATFSTQGFASLFLERWEGLREARPSFCFSASWEPGSSPCLACHAGPRGE